MINSLVEKVPRLTSPYRSQIIPRQRDEEGTRPGGAIRDPRPKQHLRNETRYLREAGGGWPYRSWHEGELTKTLLRHQ